MTTPSFVSILQAGGASRAKQQPVNSIGDSSLSGRCPHTLDPIPGRRGETRKIGVAGTRRFPEPGSNSTFAGVRVLTQPSCPFTAPGRDAPDQLGNDRNGFSSRHGCPLARAVPLRLLTRRLRDVEWLLSCPFQGLWVERFRGGHRQRGGRTPRAIISSSHLRGGSWFPNPPVSSSARAVWLVRLRNPGTEPRRCSSRPLTASVGPLDMSGRSEKARISTVCCFKVRPFA